MLQTCTCVRSILYSFAIHTNWDPSSSQELQGTVTFIFPPWAQKVSWLQICTWQVKHVTRYREENGKYTWNLKVQIVEDSGPDTQWLSQKSYMQLASTILLFKNLLQTEVIENSVRMVDTNPVVLLSPLGSSCVLWGPLGNPDWRQNLGETDALLSEHGGAQAFALRQLLVLLSLLLWFTLFSGHRHPLCHLFCRSGKTGSFPYFSFIFVDPREVPSSS